MDRRVWFRIGEQTEVKSMYGQMSDDQPNGHMKRQIEQNLKRVYDDAVREEVPDRFKLLLAQLREKDSALRAATPDSKDLGKR